MTVRHFEFGCLHYTTFSVIRIVEGIHYCLYYYMLLVASTDDCQPCGSVAYSKRYYDLFMVGHICVLTYVTCHWYRRVIPIGLRL